MRRPTFFHGAAVALTLAIGCGALFHALAPLLGAGHALRLIVPILGLSYLVCLFRRHGESTGRITAVVSWLVISGVTWLVAPPIAAYVLVHAGMLWLVRSLCFHTGALPALLDLGLSVLGVCAAAWAMSRSDSVFLATWCFFLVQAAFVVVPRRFGSRQGNTAGIDDDAFERARRRADAALRQLFLH